jgi:hypothetical protein
MATVEHFSDRSFRRSGGGDRFLRLRRQGDTFDGRGGMLHAR